MFAGQLANCSLATVFPHQLLFRIRRMPPGPIGIPSRLAFFVCGMISLMMSTVYRALQGLVPSVQGQWSVFTAALMVAGGFGMIIALLPSSWVEKACRIGPDDHRLLAVPTKMLAGFAAFSYLLTVGLDFAPRSWHHYFPLSSMQEAK
jgi:hypothetical protein